MQPLKSTPRYLVVMGLAVTAVSAGVVALVAAGAMPPIAGLLAIALPLACLFWWGRQHIASILLVFLFVMLAGTIVSQPAPKLVHDEASPESPESLIDRWLAEGSFDESLPVVIHLVFDELMSLGAIEEELPGGAETHGLLRDFGERHSFRTFDSVFSRHYVSVITLSNLLNAEYRGRMGLSDLVTEVPKGGLIPENAYFEDMAAAGYQTVVFQTSLLDFCKSKNVRMCEVFDSFDPRWGKTQAFDPTTRRVRLWDTLLRSYSSSFTSKYGRMLLAGLYGLDEDGIGDLGFEGRFDVQMFPNWFRRFTTFVAQVPRGTHVFAHFMVPHSPYLLTEKCVVGGVPDTGYYLAKRYSSEAEIEVARQRYYGQYLAQVRCLARSMDAMMGEIAEVEALSDAKIIIHGDHGARISRGKLLEQYGRQDFVDNYATYFAVRAPVVEPGVDCEFTSLPQVFRRYAAPRSVARRDAGERLPVLVDTNVGSQSKVEAVMPEFGCAIESRQPTEEHGASVDRSEE